MKTTILILANLITLTIFSQENPWIPQGENPWVINSPKENGTTQKTDTTSFIVETTYESENEKYVEELNSKEEQLLDQADSDAFSLYKSKSDFGVGFGFGLFFNLFGLIPDVVYVAVNSENEKETISEIVNDSTYVHLDKKVIEKEIKPEIKSKKCAATIGGTVVGSLTQLVIAAVLVIVTF